MSDDTRPISVAELLARNGTIGSPPVSGHRRRKRRNALSVAELTGELPVVQTGEIPVVDESAGAEDPARDDEPSVQYAETGSAETVVVYATPQETAPAESESVDAGAVPEGAPDYSDAPDLTPEYDVVDAVEEAVETQPPAAGEMAEVEPPATRRGKSAHPRSSIPLPRRRRGPERSHDPRPRRRSAGAEQMAYDPVDEAVDLNELVAEQAPPADAGELRSYLQSADGTLFSGETVADDIARRGLVPEFDDDDQAYADDDYEPAEAAAPRPGALRVLGGSVVAVLQSLFAVVFGAGLFIAFDQLWRWNHIVALALSTLVIVALVVGVHVVRKTEDFVSILIAVAVGILVTFGPLALQST